MYIKLALKRIVEGKKRNLIGFFSVFLITVITFLFLGNYFSQQKALNNTIDFKPNTAIYYVNSHFYEDNRDDILFLLETYELDYIVMNSDSFLSTQTPQMLNVHKYGGDIVQSGVLSYNFDVGRSTIEDVELLHGRLWHENETSVVVIDEYTALSAFGYSNVVGEKLVLQGEEFLIIGVVSDTSQRLNELKRCESLNDICFERLFNSDVYMPFEDGEIYLKLINYSNNLVGYERLIETLEQRDNNLEKLFMNKSTLISNQIGTAKIFYVHLAFFGLFFVLFGMLMLFILSSKKIYDYEKLVALGFRKNEFIKLFLLENLFLGLIINFQAALTAIFILMIFLLRQNILIYFDYGAFVTMIMIGMIVMPLLILLMNFSTFGLKRLKIKQG